MIKNTIFGIGMKLKQKLSSIIIFIDETTAKHRLVWGKYQKFFDKGGRFEKADWLFS